MGPFSTASPSERAVPVFDEALRIHELLMLCSNDWKMNSRVSSSVPSTSRRTVVTGGWRRMAKAYPGGSLRPNGLPGVGEQPVQHLARVLQQPEVSRAGDERRSAPWHRTGQRPRFAHRYGPVFLPVPEARRR